MVLIFMWAMCGACLTHIDVASVEKLKERIYLLCVLVFALSTVNAIYDWLLSCIKLDIKNLKEINNAK